MTDDDWKWIAAGGAIASIVAGLLFLGKKLSENKSRIEKLEQSQSKIWNLINQIKDNVFEYQSRNQIDISQILSEYQLLLKKLSQLERTASKQDQKLEIKELEALLKATTNDKLRERGAPMYA